MKINEELLSLKFTVEDYKELLSEFDSVVCESIAISQKSANRYVAPHIGYGSQIFTRLCAHSQCLIRAAPLSRWSKSDYNNWDFSEIAPHVRAILEGYLFYMYLSEPPQSEAEWQSRLWVMHMNDCMKRLDLMQSLERQEDILFFSGEKEKIAKELNKNEYFISLPEKIRKGCISGKFLKIYSRDELIIKYNLDKVFFDKYFDLLSHYTHILPFSFYGLEPNGRGTGLLNDDDLAYLCLGLCVVSDLMDRCNDRVVDFFPDVQIFRKGKKSIFSPGPRENLPQLKRERENKNAKKKKKR
jgi:hypothetical protein